MAKRPPVGQVAALLEAVRAGARYKDAAIAAGLVWEDARDLWADPEWRGAVLKMRHSFETESLVAISEAGKSDWKAKAWLLERLKKDRYSAQSKQEVEVTVRAIPFRSVVSGQVFDAEAEEVPKALPAEAAPQAALPKGKKAKKEARA